MIHQIYLTNGCVYHSTFHGCVIVVKLSQTTEMVSAMQIETIGIIENFEDTDYLDVIVACPLTILTTIKRRRRKRRNRVIWVRSWVRNRMQFIAYNNLLVQL